MKMKMFTRLLEDAGFEVKEVLRNKTNLEDEPGFSIQKPGRNLGVCISVSDVMMAGDVKKFAADLIEKLKTLPENDQINADDLLKLENVVYSLYNYELNKQFESDLSFRWMDLLFVPELVGVNDEGRYSIKVNNETLKGLGVTEENLDEAKRCVIANTLKRFPVKTKTMRSVLEELLFSQENVDSLDYPALISTNDIGVTGVSSVILSGEVKRIAELWECDIAILPSSIHEVILVRASEGLNNLVDMVNEVNSTVVGQNEFLSNSVYCYKRDVDKYECYGGM